MGLRNTYPVTETQKQELSLLEAVRQDFEARASRSSYADWLREQGRHDEAEQVLSLPGPRPPATRLRLFADSADELSLTMERLASDRGLYWCEDLYLGYNTALAPALAGKLARSIYARRICALELHEIAMTPADLEEFLKLPALRKLSLRGGCSADWGGAEYHFPSIGEEHLERLRESPHASRLRQVILEFQSLPPEAAPRLLQALPDLEILTIDGRRIRPSP